MSNFLTNPTKPRLTQIVSMIALIIFLPFLLFGAQQLAELVSKAAGTPAHIVVNAKLQEEPLNLNFYHAFAQGGEETDDMLAPVAGQVKALHPQLIRLDHLFDNCNVVGKSGDQLTFTWTCLDAKVNTILSTGAKPLLALSYMPAAIAQNGIIGPPNNWNDWATVVQKTIEHYSGKSGENISGVYYEVWNEPDLNQFGSWKLSDYLTLYRYASRGAQSATGVNRFYLGGPATTYLKPDWITGLVNSGARVDFFSWHTYAANPAQFYTDQNTLSTLLQAYPSFALTPVLITEFGFTGSKSTLYASQYAAAHTAAVIRQLLTNGITYAFSFEPKDGPSDAAQDDGWGLITHETNGAKPKPRYYIYSFVDQMAGTRLNLTGEGSWVTGFASTKNGVLRILLVNFDPDGTHTESVPVTIGNLDAGTYTYEQHYFLGGDTTTTETVTAPENQTLGTLNAGVKSNMLQKQVIMPASSIVVLTLTKQP